MSWKVIFHDTFAEEFAEMELAVQKELVATVGLLKQFGPRLGRPRVDTLNASRHANMKEIRFSADNGV